MKRNLQKLSLNTHLPYLIVVVFLSIIVKRNDDQKTQHAQNLISLQYQIIKLEKDLQKDYQTQINAVSIELQSFANKNQAVELTIQQQVQKIQNSIDDIISQLQAQKSELKDFQICTNQVNNLTKNLETQQAELKQQISLLSTKLDVSTQFANITQSIEEIQRVSFEIPTLKSQLDLVSLKVNSDTFNQIEIFGPFYPTNFFYVIQSKTSFFEIFQTTQSTSFFIKAKSIVTLIATGHTLCNSSCNSWISFLVDRQVNLPQSDLNMYFGMGYVTDHWSPLSLTQEFTVEKGVHEFQLGAIYQSGILYLNGLSFIIKVTYLD